MARKRNKKHSRQSCGISEFQMLEPRLFLSTTVMYREGGSGSYTPTTFDDNELDYASDTVNNSWAALVSGASGNLKYGLLAVKNLFTLLPATDVNGSALSISSAKLHLLRYNAGTSSDTIYVDRMTSNWLINAAGSNESNTTWKHESLSPSQFWAGGGSISASDYTTTHEGSAAFVNTQYQDCTITITSLVQDIYSTSTNDGLIIRSSNTSSFDSYYTSEEGSAYDPILEITYDYIPKVTVTATDASAAEPSNTGTYAVTRTGTGSALTVNYTMSGAATPGTDYTSLSGSVTIPSGQTSATITLTPINDNIVEPTEDAILTLTAGTGYTIGTQNAATVNIADNDSTVSIVATTNAAEPSTNGLFTVTRAGYTGAAVTVNYSVSGSSTATPGSDYNTLSGTVTIASGQTTATIPVTVIDDSLVEGTETVILNLTSGTDYTVGSPNTATVNIADNDSGSFGITGVSGIVNARQPITISGNGFGTGPSDVFFDDFEGGTAGTPILVGPGSAEVGGWSAEQNAVAYTNTSKVSGNLAFQGDFSSSSAPNLYHDLPAGTSQIYASWWVKIPSIMPGTNETAGINYKQVWIEGAGRSSSIDDMDIIFCGNSQPNTGAQDDNLNITGNCILNSNPPGPADRIPWYNGNQYHAGDWVRETLAVTGDTANGTIKLTFDDVTDGFIATYNPPPQRTWGLGSPDQWGSIAFNAYGFQTTGSIGVMDDIYCADGPNANATVEIGNASTYAACTNLSTCPTTGWSGTSITANVNFGSLSTSGSLYLYVTKADGTVSAGYPLTVSQAPLANTDNYSIYDVSRNPSLTKTAATGVLANDIDLQGGTITASKVSGPSHGSVTLNSDGSFTYTPTAGYSGTDSFTYQDSDGTHTGNTGTVNISVRQLMVDFWKNGANVFSQSGSPLWNTVTLGSYVSNSTDGPGGVMGGSSGTTTFMKVSGSAYTFSTTQTVYATWYNDSATPITFTPQISFDDTDGKDTGASGTWYPMSKVYSLYPQQSLTSTYTIDAGSAGSHTLINIVRNIANQANLMLDMIELG